MSGPTFTTSDLSRKSGDIIAEALRHPVTITQRKKPRLVVLSVEDYEQLRRNADPRKVYRTADMPREILEEVLTAMDTYIGSEDEA